MASIMTSNDNNEQYIVPRRFAELRLIQKQKEDELRSLLHDEFDHLLPIELWDIILSMVFTKEQLIAYFGFKRKDSFYKDDHYLFEGTEKDWSLAIEQMRSVVSPHDAQDDIPTDTYCSGFCEQLTEGLLVSCPDEFGNQCDCRWNHYMFNIHEFTKYRNNYYLLSRNKIRLSEKGYLWNLSN
jgi:hypothetical protein